MALINCPECNTHVSDQAVFCPKCGYPIRERLGNSQPVAAPMLTSAPAEVAKTPKGADTPKVAQSVDTTERPDYRANVDLSQFRSLFDRYILSNANIVLALATFALIMGTLCTSFIVWRDAKMWDYADFHKIEYMSHFGEYLFLWCSLGALFIAALRRDSLLTLITSATSLVALLLLPSIEDLELFILSLQDTIEDSMTWGTNVPLSISLIAACILSFRGVAMLRRSNTPIALDKRAFADICLIAMLIALFILHTQRPWMEWVEVVMRDGRGYILSYSILQTIACGCVMLAIFFVVQRRYLGALCSLGATLIPMIVSLFAKSVYMYYAVNSLSRITDASSIDFNIEPTSFLIVAIVLTVVALAILGVMYKKREDKESPKDEKLLVLCGIVAVLLFWAASLPSVAYEEIMNDLSDSYLPYTYFENTPCAIFAISLYSAILLMMCRRWHFAAAAAAITTLFSVIVCLSAEVVGVVWVPILITTLSAAMLAITIYKCRRTPFSWDGIKSVVMIVLMAMTIYALSDSFGMKLDLIGLSSSHILPALLMVVWTIACHPKMATIFALIIGIICVNAEVAVGYERIVSLADMVSIATIAGWGLIITALAGPVIRLVKHIK